MIASLVKHGSQRRRLELPKTYIVHYEHEAMQIPKSEKYRGAFGAPIKLVL